MMAAMIVEPTDEPITICDPACGSGRFFIAAQPRTPKATFYGIDRDLTCVHMAALNMLVRNADATIVQGNTLSMEAFGGYITCRSVFGGEIRPLTAAQASTVLTAAATTPAENDPAATPKPFKVDCKGQFGFDF